MASLKNWVMNVGLNDSKTHKQEVPTEKAINMIGKKCQNCTITETIGFYKGERENSLKVEVYGMDFYRITTIAEVLCAELNQECIAITCEGYTFFIGYGASASEYQEWMDALNIA